MGSRTGAADKLEDDLEQARSLLSWREQEHDDMGFIRALARGFGRLEAGVLHALTFMRGVCCTCEWETTDGEQS